MRAYVFRCSPNNGHRQETPACPKVPNAEVAASIDHLVGVRQQRRWDINAEGLRGLQIDHQLEPGWQLDGEIGRFRTFQDLPYRITTTANLAPTTFRFDAALLRRRERHLGRTRAPTHSTCSQPAARVSASAGQLSICWRNRVAFLDLRILFSLRFFNRRDRIVPKVNITAAVRSMKLMTAD
jgi:hypothetical protein